MSVLCELVERRRGRVAHGRLILFLIAAVVAALLYNPPSLGQSTFGSIVGSVKDASGDVVGNAGVVLMNSGTLKTMTFVYQ